MQPNIEDVHNAPPFDDGYDAAPRRIKQELYYDLPNTGEAVPLAPYMRLDLNSPEAYIFEYVCSAGSQVTVGVQIKTASRQEWHDHPWESPAISRHTIVSCILLDKHGDDPITECRLVACSPRNHSWLSLGSFRGVSLKRLTVSRISPITQAQFADVREGCDALMANRALTLKNNAILGALLGGAVGGLTAHAAGSLLNDFVPIAPWLRLCTTAGGIIFGGAQGHAIGANTLECQELILACTVEELIVGLAGSLAAGSTSAFTTYLGVNKRYVLSILRAPASRQLLALTIAANSTSISQTDALGIVDGLETLLVKHIEENSMGTYAVRQSTEAKTILGATLPVLRAMVPMLQAGRMVQQMLLAF